MSLALLDSFHQVYSSKNCVVCVDGWSDLASLAVSNTVITGTLKKVFL